MEHDHRSGACLHLTWGQRNTALWLHEHAEARDTVSAIDSMPKNTCFLALAVAACFEEQQQRLQDASCAVRRPQVPLA